MNLRRLTARSEQTMRIVEQSGGRGQFGIFDCVLEPDPEVESYSVNDSRLPADDRWLTRAICAGAEAGWRVWHERGERFCGVRIDLLAARYHEVDNTPRVFSLLARRLVGERLPGLTEPIPAIDPAWRTLDVLTLARSLQLTHDRSTLPVLADALEDAGCDAPWILDHCRRCRHHGDSCWVVEWALAAEPSSASK